LNETTPFSIKEVFSSVGLQAFKISYVRGEVKTASGVNLVWKLGVGALGPN